MSKYIDQLVKDLKDLYYSGHKFHTIYIGGGTPSCLKIEELIKILKITKLLIAKNRYEFTIEANPESIDENKLSLFKSSGINRISIGIQTFNKKLLKSINRDYGVDYFDLISEVKKYFNNINVDLIYGLPNQSLSDLHNDLEEFLKLDINHISTYSLSINPSTLFYLNKITEISEDTSRIYYDLILETLRQNGFERYEVSNFSKQGYESKHNLTYWHDEEYIGVGCGASGYIYPYRYKNSSSLIDYIKGKRNVEKELVFKKDDLEYFLICNLRLKDGFSLYRFKEKFGFDFLEKYGNKIEKFIKSGHLALKNGFLCCTDEGIITLDLILRDIL